MLKSTVTYNNTLIKLPGLADVHVHLREPGATQKEDFATGTKAAIAGGFTQVLDMPNNNPPTITPQALEEKEKLAKGKIWCDLGFNFGTTLSSSKYFQKVKNKVFGAKVYMSHTTGPLLVKDKKDLTVIFDMWQGPLPLMIHAQGEMIDLAITLSRKFKKPIHICHTTGDQITKIKKAKSEGLQITCEVTPHHLFLTKSDVKRLGPFGLMKPPLELASNQKKLWDNLDEIDIIATDHAPHTKEEKEKEPAPFGVPGLETALPLMLTAVADGKLTTQRLIEMMATNPRKIFHLPDQHDTFVLVDFAKTLKISKENLFTKCHWTPFEGMDGRGEVKKVVLLGKVVYQEGQLMGIPQGKTISPTLLL